MSLLPSLSPEAEEETEEDRFANEAVRLYLRSGSLAQVSRTLGIPIYELQKLAKSQWWMDEVGLLRKIEQAALDAELTEIMDTTLAALKDRLVNGEEMIDKDGCLHKKMLSGATLCKIADTVFTKRQLIRGLPTAVTNEGSKLTELAEKLEELGRAQAAKTINQSTPVGGMADQDASD